MGYFFLPEAAFLSATAWLFFWAADEAAAFFWEDFFWFAFGERSPMDLIWFGGYCCPAECQFLRRSRTVAPEAA